jgi:fatty-acyl-CoA synthase
VSGGLTETLLDRVARQAELRPDRLALAFPPEGQYSWSSLHAALRRLADHFAGAGVRPGARLLVLSDSPREQALAFLGGMACAAVPTILSHPSVKQTVERFVPTFLAMLKRGATTHVICSRDIEERAGAWLALPGSGVTLLGLPDEGLLVGPGRDFARWPDPAFLQYSSGTTGMRKGVAVSHAMLREQSLLYAEAIGMTEDDTVVSWLPLYHDMGLVGCLLIPMYVGAASVHMSPFRWVQNPASILDLIAEHRATFAWFPNFAFRLLASRVPVGHPANFASVKALVNSGEPLRPAAIDAFLARFAPAGLRAEQLQCSYGMAENTFAITQTRMGGVPIRDTIDRDRFQVDKLAIPAAPGARALELLSCGRPLPRHGVRIRLDDGALAADRQIGEIEITSPCLFDGYAGASEDAPPTRDGWFRTGDLGYFAGGELFVSGRSKDLIIHRGINLYPEDIEAAVGQVRGCKPGRAVVFGSYDEEAGTELIVALLEADGDGVAAPELARRVRARIFEHFGVVPADVCVVAPGTLVKSTSGKLSRGANRELYLTRFLIAGRK